MTRLSDGKPTACGGPVMRRQDEHIIHNSEMTGTRSGDTHPRPPMINTALATVADSDPRWGKTPCDPDWPEQSDISD